MKTRNPFPTSAENIVLNLLFEWLGERRLNRTIDEYATIARRVPKAIAVHAYVNQRLREMSEVRRSPSEPGLCSTAVPSSWPFQICYFKAGDRSIWFADFPTSISLETVRTALKKSGLLELCSWADAPAA